MENDSTFTIGVALSSGGAAGLAHVGVLEELQAAGLRIGCVAGTSAGALVGAVFASNQLREFRDRMTVLTRRGRMALFDPIWPRAGLFAGKRAMDLLRPHVGHLIEELPIRFGAIATDLQSARGVLLAEGEVIDAIRASIAIPGVFTPVHWRGRLLVDGALADPLPVAAARGLGAQYVIAVNAIPTALTPALPIVRPPSEPLVRRLRDVLLRLWGSPGRAIAVLDEMPDDARECLSPDSNLSEILSRASAVIQANIAAARLRDHPANYCITPDVGDIGLFDLNRTAEAIEAGRAAAREALPHLLAAVASAQASHRSTTRWPWRQVLAARTPACAAA